MESLYHICRSGGNFRQAVALAYAEQCGWPVFPLYIPRTPSRCSCGNARCPSIGKHPRTPHGLKDATTDLTIIKKTGVFWTDSNIGVVTGTASGLVVLDVDPRHGGDESLDRLEHQHGALPVTVEAKTGGGGRHLFFQHPGGGGRHLLFLDPDVSYIPSRTIAPGLDVKADGGYVVVYPSLHPTGQRYMWKRSCAPSETPLASLPSWLLPMVTKKPHGSSLECAGGELPIPSGTRNNTLTSFAGTMRRRGMTEAAIAAALQVENRLRCKPPLPPAEVQCIAKSVARYAPASAEGDLDILIIRGLRP